jgi:hypothetical protein
MKFRHVLSGLVFVSFVTFAISSCSKGSLGNAKLTLFLTDAPADYDQVNIEILRIEIRSTNDLGEDYWRVLRFNNPGVYNLLEFRNGIDTLLSSVDLPPGRISQVRLIVGSNNSIMVDSNLLPLPLVLPSMQESGLKLNVHADLREGQERKLWIDFDAARSVIETGNGSYLLKPVLRTFTLSETGSLKGNIQPQVADATVYAIAGLDTLAAIPDANTGDFLIRGLTPGMWKVVAQGQHGYQDQVFDHIRISRGETNVLDTITLMP